MTACTSRKPNKYAWISLILVIELDLEILDRILYLSFEGNPLINKDYKAVARSTNRVPGNLINMRGFRS